jgi:hypothetical protein
MFVRPSARWVSYCSRACLALTPHWNAYRIATREKEYKFLWGKYGKEDTVAGKR